MTTSGTSTFSRNRDQLISSALRKINAFESGETPDAAAVSEASDALNAMIKHWQAAGVEIWETMEIVLFPVAEQFKYVIGPSTTDRITGEYVETSLSAAAASGASTISVDSVVGIATTYTIGVLLDSGSLQWTTVNGAPSGTTVTLTTPLTGAASDENAVFVYQTSNVRPIRVLDGRRYNLSSKIDVPLEEMDRGEYQDMPNKTSSGAVNSFFYDRRGGRNDSAFISFWPAPADATEAIKLTVARPIEIFSVAADTPDFPQEWIRAIEWGLADELADEYDVPEPKRTRIERRAAQYLAEANWNEKELISFQLVPDTGR